MLKKISIIVACILLSIGIIWGLGFYSIRSYVKTHQEEIKTEIQKQAGYPIHFDDIKTKFNLTGPYLAIQNVNLQPKVASDPFLTIDNVEIHPYLFQSILKRNFIIKSLVIDSPQIEVVWDSNNKTFSIKGLETKGDNNKTQSFPLPLKLPFDLILKSAEITWVLKSSVLVQELSGKLKSITTKESENMIIFEGTQALQVNGGEFFKPSSFTLKADLVQQKLNIETSFNEAKIKIDWELAKKMHCSIDFNQFDLSFLHENVLLTEQDPNWLRWITFALQTGKLKGKMEFDYQSGDLDLTGDLLFQNLDLQYSRLWPKIQEMQGSIKIEKEKITVIADKGQILNMPMKKTTAVIEPIAIGQSPVVYVDGEVQGTLEQALEFLALSPLKETVLPPLTSLSPSGKMNLKLNLQIPTKGEPLEVEGEVKVTDGKLTLNEFGLPVEQLNGTFGFDKKGITISDAHAKFEGNDVVISATPEFIIADTKLSIDLLKQQFGIPLLDFFQGETQVKIKRSQKENKLIIESELQGIGINLPSPLNKDPDKIQAFNLTVQKELPLIYYSFNAKDLIDGKLTFSSQEGKLTLKNGHIVLGNGTSDWTNQNALLIGGKLESLEINQWKSFIAEKSPMQSGLPVKIYLFVDDLHAFDMNLSKIWIDFYSKSPNTWKLDGESIKGTIELPTSNENRYKFDLELLKLKGEQDKKQLSSKILSPQNKMEISFHSKNLNLGEVSYGDVAFNLVPIAKGYAIEGLIANNGHFFLEGSGEWDINEDNSKTSLKGQILSDNLGQTLSQMNLTSSFDEGQGRLQFDLQWNDAPYEFSLKNAEGIAYLQVKSGRIRGVNAGLGRILGLLNIDTIKRRLQLDFSDVLKGGFVFDTLDGSFKFSNGVAQTNDFFVNGPAAKIDLAGNANLESKELDLRMTVTPTAVSSSLPIAAGLASGNPAVGLGVWVVDKITGSKISNITQHRYRVTGTWEAPHIEELNTNTNQTNKK